MIVTLVLVRALAVMKKGLLTMAVCIGTCAVLCCTVMLAACGNDDVVDSGEPSADNSLTEEHTHVAGDTWYSDDEYHWHLCVADGCTTDGGEIMDKALHTVEVDWEPAEDGSYFKACTVCGSRTEFAVQREAIEDDTSYLNAAVDYLNSYSDSYALEFHQDSYLSGSSSDYLFAISYDNESGNSYKITEKNGTYTNTGEMNFYVSDDGTYDRYYMTYTYKSSILMDNIRRIDSNQTNPGYDMMSGGLNGLIYKSFTSGLSTTQDIEYFVDNFGDAIGCKVYYYDGCTVTFTRHNDSITYTLNEYKTTYNSEDVATKYETNNISIYIENGRFIMVEGSYTAYDCSTGEAGDTLDCYISFDYDYNPEYWPDNFDEWTS